MTIHVESLLEDSPARRCLDLIERYAPRFMRCGGGHLAEECPDRKPMTAEEQAEIVALGSAGELTATQIGARFGYSQSRIRKFLDRHHGIRCPDGRAGRRWKVSHSQ